MIIDQEIASVLIFIHLEFIYLFFIRRKGEIKKTVKKQKKYDLCNRTLLDYATMKYFKELLLLLLLTLLMKLKKGVPKKKKRKNKKFHFIVIWELFFKKFTRFETHVILNISISIYFNYICYVNSFSSI